jgi:hypothetical protein
MGTFALIFWLFALPAAGADWPMWRCDDHRSAASPEDLPAQLHLQWARELPPVVPAWPNEPRLQFDTCYEPVVMGKTLFVGSPNDGSVTALDTETGQERWKFYTEGPVRFAPVAWQGKLYVVSDDGFLYCLDAATGAPLWKVRGAPEVFLPHRQAGQPAYAAKTLRRGGPTLSAPAIPRWPRRRTARCSPCGGSAPWRV